MFALHPMTKEESNGTADDRDRDPATGSGRALDDSELAVVAFLARYSGRTLEACRRDLRTYFQMGGRQQPRSPGRHPASR